MDRRAAHERGGPGRARRVPGKTPTGLEHSPFMSLRSRFFALTYDRQLAKVEKFGLGNLRKESLAGASGRVLEIGAGTGANLALYGPRVESLTLTEPDRPMLRRLERRAGERERPLATVLRAPAEDIPFEDGALRHGRLDARAVRRRRPAACAP